MTINQLIQTRIKECISKTDWFVNFEFTDNSESPEISCSSKTLKSSFIKYLDIAKFNIKTLDLLDLLDLEINEYISIIITSLNLDVEYIFMDMCFICPDIIRNIKEIKDLIPITKLNFKTKMLEDLIIEKESEIEYLKDIIRNIVTKG